MSCSYADKLNVALQVCLYVMHIVLPATLCIYCSCVNVD